jgi:3,4-dihydroxy 2-butanone 4-phosphate synthase/GTP cyclohydrolase II
VLSRPGHTEAAGDLPRLAGLYPAGTLCEIVNDDGTMARGPELAAFARRHGLAYINVSEIIAYRRGHEQLITLAAMSGLPMGATSMCYIFRPVERSALCAISHPQEAASFAEFTSGIT